MSSLFPELKYSCCDLIIAVHRLSQLTVWDELTLSFKAKPGKCVLIDHVSVSPRTALAPQGRQRESAPRCLLLPSCSHWVSAPLPHAQQTFLHHCIAITHSHVALQVNLRNMSLVWIRQQLFWDPAVTHQICLLGLQNWANTAFKSEAWLCSRFLQLLPYPDLILCCSSVLYLEMANCVLSLHYIG